MFVSADIKEYLSSDSIKRASCCVSAFEAGRAGTGYVKGCGACLQHYVAGVFVACGTVANPTKGYHLALKPAEADIEALSALLTAAGFPPRVGVTRSNKPRLYYKDGDTIIDFLTYIGAGKFSMAMIQEKITKEIRAMENRRSNAEFANLDRAATAAAEQSRAIALLKKHGALSSLSKELEETANIREQNPFMPLGELCMQFSPPISKSGLNHRLKRLIDEADKLEKELKSNKK